MNFGGASSPSGLRPPVSSASPSGSNNTTTGRPQLWTPSSQRKVSRLYLYTTLSLDKIMAVVHAKSPDPVPGIESANKKLNSLLNKQPRWLHPRNEEDMGRRLDELALSPTRTTSSWNSINSQARSPNNSIPSLNPNPTPHLMRNNGISPTLEVPPFNQFPTQQHTPNRSVPLQQHTQNRSIPHQQARAAPNQQQNDGVFQRFLRSTSFMSASTDCTTGTLHRLLNDYSDAYVKSVKRLVKRYTAPINRGTSLSPISDDEPSESTWMHDSDSPPPLPNGPDHLPGEFLLLDELFGQQPPCFEETEQHIKKSCLCRPNEQIKEPAWVTVRGLSNGAQRMLQYNTEGMKVEDRDPFGNTILHLMAARGMKDHLFQALLLNPNPHILNAQNTAGQTLLHVLHRGWFYNETFLCELLRSLAQRNFDFGARDHYGRSFSHILLARDVSPDMRNFFLQICQSDNCTKRDAFNVTPTFALRPEPTFAFNRAYTQAMDLDPPVPASVPEEDENSEPYHVSVVAKEARLIEFISKASERGSGSMEDSEGRNGLHCLAAATLSKSSVLHKHDLDEKGEPSERPRRKDRTPKDLDSCTERYNLRLSLLEGLLDVQADPNHYDIHGYTPLMAFAAQLPEDDDYKVGGRILHKLVEAGADINARNRSGETALHVAVRCGRKLAVKQLVEDGASVHARDAAGRSVLDVADIKMKSLGGQDTEQYAHLEACRAWLSGQTGKAVQNPTVMQEWSVATV